MESKSIGVCSSNMLLNFWKRDKAKLEAQYTQAMEYAKKTTLALVSATREKPAYEFLLSKGWHDAGQYHGNDHGDIHLMTLGIAPIPACGPTRGRNVRARQPRRKTSAPRS